MPIELLLAEDQLAVDRHFEDAAARGDNVPLGNLKFKFLQNFVRQTDGFLSVASLRAIFDSDVQLAHGLSLGWDRYDDHFITVGFKRLELI